jgi:signal peptidase I
MKHTIKTRVLKFWRWVRPMVIVVLVLTSFRSAVADWNDVPTGSMKPTILEGDRIFVNKLAYDLKVPFTTWHIVKWSQPQRGEVVVLFSPKDGTRLVKRVVGVPGDIIEMRNNHLFVNGKPASYVPLEDEIIDLIDRAEQPAHSFAREVVDGFGHPIMSTPGRPAPRSFRPMVIPEGRFFVMGDNRDESADSRAFGMVDRDRIVGRTSHIAVSVDPDNHYAPRWERFFRRLP